MSNNTQEENQCTYIAHYRGVHPFANSRGTREYYPAANARHGHGYHTILAEYLGPGHSGTRLLDGYPGAIRVATVKRVPGYQPKKAVNTREVPGYFPPKN